MLAGRAVRGLALLTLLCVAPAALAQRAAIPREAAVPFRVGETLTYDVSWSSMLVAGTATAQVVEKKTAPPGAAYAIVADGRPVPLLARLYNLYYKMDTLVDSFTLLTRGNSLYVEEGAGKMTDTTRFDRTARRAFYERRGETIERADFAIPAGTQDGLAVLYAVRGRSFRTGERFSMPVADGGSMYTVQMEVGAPGAIRVPMGEFSAWTLKTAVIDAGGQPVGKDIAVWISTDARRLPVKLQAELPVGSFVLALKEATE